MHEWSSKELGCVAGVSSGEIMLMKYYCISVTEHFTAIFEPKRPKVDTVSEMQYQFISGRKINGRKYISLPIPFQSYLSNTGALVSPGMLLFCWGRKDLVQLFLFLTELSCKQACRFHPPQHCSPNHSAFQQD